jgi:hypothetical protein
MSEAESLWRAVSGEAGLTSEEQERIALAVEADEGLAEELTYLLGHLRADLSAPFLRAFVDRLPADDAQLDSAAFAIQPALQSVLVPPPEGPGGPRA